jgi:hypothetical protein
MLANETICVIISFEGNGMDGEAARFLFLVTTVKLHTGRENYAIMFVAGEEGWLVRCKQM